MSMAEDKEKRANAQPKIAELREKFLSKFNGNILDDTYDDADVKWVKTSDAFLRNVLCAFKTGGNIDKSVNLIDEVLRFRAKYKLNSLKVTDINATVVKADPILIQGVDKQGYKIMYLKVAAVKKGEHPIEEVKKYLAYVMNKHYMSEPESKVVCMFDCTDAGVTNFDTEMAKFVIACNDTYFPEISTYALMFKLGRTLEVVWALIKTFMNAEQTKKTHVVTRKTVVNYIAEDQLLPHMIKEKK